MYERRQVVKVDESGNMAVVDRYTGLFGEKKFEACVLVQEMHPVTVCRSVGNFDTEAEAAEAARTALPNGDKA